MTRCPVPLPARRKAVVVTPPPAPARRSALAIGAEIVGAAAGIAALAGAGLAGFALLVSRKAEQAVPMTGRFVEIDGQRIHVVEEGKAATPGAPTLVMVHGLGGNVRNFTHSLVAQLRDEYRCVVIERPGSGYSTRPRGSAANIRAQAWTIADTIAALGIEKPLLVGHSLGGAITLATALDHPDSIGGIALIAPLTQVQVTKGPPFGRLAIRSPLLRTLVAWTIAIPMSIRTRDEMLGQIFGPDPVPADFGTTGGGLLGARPKAFESVSADLVALNRDLPAMVARYGSLDLPAGVLFGTGDRLLNVEKHGTSLGALIPGIDVETVEGAGHMLPLTHTARCAAFIRRMATRVADARA